MRTTTFKLPNGFKNPAGDLITEVEVRKLDGYDEDTMLDKDNLREGNVLDKLLKRVITRVGSEEDPEKIAKLYDNYFLMGDTTHLLVSMRIWGIGKILRFETACPRCDRIGKHRIDLTTLHVTEQPEGCRGKTDFLETITTDSDGNPLDEPIIIRFRPLRVSDQKLLVSIKEQYPKERATREMLVNLLEINGKRPEVNEVKKLAWASRHLIRQAIDSKMGGTDIELVMTCGKCGDKPFKAHMPIDVRPFFFPEVDSSNTARMAISSHDSGTTPTSSEPASDGSPAKSSDSPSKSDSST